MDLGEPGECVKCEGSEKREEWRRGPTVYNLVLLCLERRRRQEGGGEEGEMRERGRKGRRERGDEGEWE